MHEPLLHFRQGCEHSRMAAEPGEAADRAAGSGTRASSQGSSSRVSINESLGEIKEGPDS